MNTRYTSLCPCKKFVLSGVRPAEASAETAAADWSRGQPDDPSSAAGQPGLPDTHGRQVAPR
jgi:hypothetical protein